MGDSEELQYRRHSLPNKKAKLTPGSGSKHQHRYPGPGMECSVCHTTFESEEKWQWHEERHIGLGIFKCAHCDSLAESAVKIFDHEQLMHTTTLRKPDSRNYGGYDMDAEIVKGRKDKLVPRKEFEDDGSISITQTKGGNGSEQKVRLDATKHLIPAKQSFQQRTEVNIAYPMKPKLNKVYSVKKVTQMKGVGVIEEREVDLGDDPSGEGNEAKAKQLPHWMYVCKKCDLGAESINKAKLHYPVCFPDSSVPFEKSVVKYRQGHYGKSQCPLCVKRYCSNGGFLIHCTHSHADYRRKFSNTNDEKIRCVSCKEKFDFPTEFHAHLVEGECDSLPKSATITSRTAVPGMKIKKTYAPPKTSEDDKAKSKPSPTPSPSKLLPSQMHPPRSARLAKRAQKLAEQMEESGTGSDFPPADCPICGTAQISNISQHLNTDHDDMNVSVNRISAALLRCRKCFITFAICDLLDHNESCTGSKVEEAEPSIRRASVTGLEVASTSISKEGIVLSIRSRSLTPQLSPKPAAPPKVPAVVPDHIGKSEIETTYSNEEIFTEENVRQALICQICGKSSKRIGVISECYRSHSIYRCVMCFNTYDMKEKYTLHVKKCHAVKNSSNRIKCPICEKSFMNVGQTTSHLYVQHLHELLNKKTDDTEEKNEESTTADSEVVGDGSDQTEADTTETPVAAVTESESKQENMTEEDSSPASLSAPKSPVKGSPKKGKPPVEAKAMESVSDSSVEEKSVPAPTEKAEEVSED